MDEASEEFIVTLVDAAVGTHTMLVFNYRPSHGALWMRIPHYQEILLADLGPSEIDTLVEELLGVSPELRGLCERVARRSGGNPFFAEELVRSLAENDVLLGAPGDYRLGQNTVDDLLPATVQAVIGARIDHLGEAQKSIIQTCSIIGKEMPLGVLETVLKLSPKEIEAGLEALRRAELIQMHSTGQDSRVVFRHPLIQEVAYSAQLRARRAKLHAAVAEAMQGYYKDRLDEFAGLVAYHYEAAGDDLKAATYWARAATWVGATHSAQAIKHWHKVRVLMESQARSRGNDTLYIMACGQIAWLGWREGLTAEDAKPFIREALARAREIDDTMISLLLFVEGRIIVASGGPADTYVERVKEALSLVDPDRDAGRVAMLNAALSHAYGWAGLLTDALAANDAALRGVSSSTRFDNAFLGYSIEHWAVSLRGRILVRLGRLREAESCFDSMIEIGERLFDPTVQIIAHFGYLDVAWCRSDTHIADHHTACIVRIADKYSSPYLRVFAFAALGMAAVIARQFTDAIKDWAAGLEFVRRTKAAMETEPEMLAYLAECYYRSGDYERAALTSEETIAIARERSARLPECRALITYAGAIFRKHGEMHSERAKELLDKAEQLIRTSGAVIYERLLIQERGAVSMAPRHG